MKHKYELPRIKKKKLWPYSLNKKQIQFLNLTMLKVPLPEFIKNWGNKPEGPE